MVTVEMRTRSSCECPHPQQGQRHTHYEELDNISIGTHRSTQRSKACWATPRGPFGVRTLAVAYNKFLLLSWGAPPIKKADAHITTRHAIDTLLRHTTLSPHTVHNKPRCILGQRTCHFLAQAATRPPHRGVNLVVPRLRGCMQKGISIWCGTLHVGSVNGVLYIQRMHTNTPRTHTTRSRSYLP